MSVKTLLLGSGATGSLPFRFPFWGRTDRPGFGFFTRTFSGFPTQRMDIRFNESLSFLTSVGSTSKTAGSTATISIDVSPGASFQTLGSISTGISTPLPGVDSTWAWANSGSNGRFSSDGLAFFLCVKLTAPVSNDWRVIRFDLTTAFDLSTASFGAASASLITLSSSFYSVFNSDASQVCLPGNRVFTIHPVTLALTGPTINALLPFNAHPSERYVYFSQDGDVLFNSNSDSSYTLGTPGSFTGTCSVKESLNFGINTSFVTTNPASNYGIYTSTNIKLGWLSTDLDPLGYSAPSLVESTSSAVDLSSGLVQPRLAISPDGLIGVVVSRLNASPYTLHYCVVTFATAFDMSSAVFGPQQTFNATFPSFPGTSNTPYSPQFLQGGSKLLIPLSTSGTSGVSYAIDLSVPYDVSTNLAGTAVKGDLCMLLDSTGGYGLHVRQSGFDRFTLSTPFDISTHSAGTPCVFDFNPATDWNTGSQKVSGAFLDSSGNRLHCGTGSEQSSIEFAGAMHTGVGSLISNSAVLTFILCGYVHDQVHHGFYGVDSSANTLKYCNLAGLEIS